MNCIVLYLTTGREWTIPGTHPKITLIISHGFDADRDGEVHFTLYSGLESLRGHQPAGPVAVYHRLGPLMWRDLKSQFGSHYHDGKMVYGVLAAAMAGFGDYMEKHEYYRRSWYDEIWIDGESLGVLSFYGDLTTCERDVH